MRKIEIRIAGLGQNNANRFEAIAANLKGVTQVDTWPGRVELTVEDQADRSGIIIALKAAGFEVPEDNDGHTAPAGVEAGVFRCAIDGMHCRSCEVTIERRLRKLPGVQQVSVDAVKGIAVIHHDGAVPSLASLTEAVRADGYTVRGSVSKTGARTSTNAAFNERRPGFWQLVGLFGLVLIVISIFSKLGIINVGPSIGGSMTVMAAFLIGLVAASSSCIAVSGGLLLSTAAKYNERFGMLRPLARMRPVFFFVAGRVLSYGILGGMIGLLGTALTPSPLITGAIAVLAAVYMFIMGLDMLHMAPPWLRRFMPRMPKFITRRVMDAEDATHPAAPFMMGAFTFFLPCGFTQALQLYALTTGSFVKSAGLLAAFALGTAPALTALGWASSSLKGKAGRFFFRFSGALVVVLAIWNVQNGFAIAGYPLSLPSITLGSEQAAASTSDPNVSFDGTTQVLRMVVNPSGYTPSSFTVRAGVPTKWEVDGTNAAGCISVLVSRPLGVKKLLERGSNTIELAALAPGTYPFSCSMGMYRGTITAL